MIDVMRLRFLLGLILVAGAFAAAAGEIAARQMTGGHAFIMSAYDLWYTLRPGSLVVAEVEVERLLHPLVWDPLITTLLAFPAWLLLGLPGLALLWWFNPRRGDVDIDEDAMFLFDRLAKRARDEGYGNEPITYTLPPRAVEQDWDGIETVVPDRPVSPGHDREIQGPVSRQLPLDRQAKPKDDE